MKSDYFGSNMEKSLNVHIIGELLLALSHLYFFALYAFLG